MKESFFSLSINDLLNSLKIEGFNTSGASLLFNYFYKKLSLNLDIPNLAQSTQTFLEEKYDFSLPVVSKVQLAGETRKFLVKFSDGLEVECVLIPFQGKQTICLSSQVGCAMKCSFCLTGTQGLNRSLKTDEIVGQLMAVKVWLNEFDREAPPISNIVFMGQGEPLHNFEAVQKACDIFLDQHGLSIGREKITISTAGYLPGLKKWQRSGLSVNLALSLHCPDDTIRDELIPLNIAYPLREVLACIKSIPLEKKRFITFEILLIDKLNDSEEFAHQTAVLIQELSPLVNIIPFNPIPGSCYQRPKDDSLERYKNVIESYNIPTMIRKTKGDEILAACGQLKS